MDAAIEGEEAPELSTTPSKQAQPSEALLVEITIKLTVVVTFCEGVYQTNTSKGQPTPLAKQVMLRRAVDDLHALCASPQQLSTPENGWGRVGAEMEQLFPEAVATSNCFEQQCFRWSATSGRQHKQR